MTKVERQRKYRERHYEACKERQRIWAKSPNAKLYRLKNKEAIKRQARRRHLLSKYGITLEQFDAMEKKCNGICPICLKPPSEGVLVIDHCHETGSVRGLLCRQCNAGLGTFGDDSGVIFRALQYLYDAANQMAQQDSEQEPEPAAA